MVAVVGGAGLGGTVGLGGAIGLGTSLLLGALSVVVIRALGVTVTPKTVTANRFKCLRRSFSVSRVASVVLAPVWDNSETSSIMHLVIRDCRGATLLRLSGLSFTDNALREVVAAIDHPATIIVDPVAASDFVSVYGGEVGWLERRPRARIAAYVLLALATGVFVLWLMGLLGMPIAGI